MAKKTRRATAANASAGENPRRPCPCGSGKRYKACHGSAGGAFVIRPFAGLAAERDLVALREFVASATAPLRVGERTVTLGSLLPMAAPAMVRERFAMLPRLASARRSAGARANRASEPACR